MAGRQLRAGKPVGGGDQRRHDDSQHDRRSGYAGADADADKDAGADDRSQGPRMTAPARPTSRRNWPGNLCHAHTLKRKWMTSPSSHGELSRPSAQFARGPGRRLAAQAHVGVEGDDLGTDEAALEVGVDDAGGLGRLAPGVRSTPVLPWRCA